MNFFKKLFKKKEEQQVESKPKNHDIRKLSAVNGDYDTFQRLDMLIDYAQRHGVGIVVGRQSRADYIKLVDESVKVYRLAPTFTFEVKKAQEGLLIDETVKMEMIKWLKEQPDLDISGGFIGEE